MPPVVFHGFPHTDYYASATQHDWRKNEVRPVGDDEAEYLLQTFPGCFAVVGGEVSSVRRGVSKRG